MKKQRSNQENKQGIENSGEYSRELDVSNEDLVTEILLRVPAKSLIRFKCVSKAWLSLISDPYFSSNHARRNSNSLVSGFYFYYKTLPPKVSRQFRSISLSNKKQSLPNFTFLDRKPEIVDACNGLILCSNENGMFSGGYTVCNPTTRKYKRILAPLLDPYFSVEEPEPLSFLISWIQRKNISPMAWLAFDPSISNHYKIIRFVHTYSKEVLDKMDIYSSENSSWKRCPTIEKIDELENSSQVYWNKSLNWVTKDHFHIRFDVENEKLTSTPLGKITENLAIELFGSCQGNLILVTYNPRLDSNIEDPSSYLTILEMKSNKNSWVVKYNINLQQCSLRKVIGLYSYVVNNGNNGDDALLLSVVTKQDLDNFNRKGYTRFAGPPGKIVSIRSNSNTTQELDHLPYGEIRSTFFHFLETLSPV